MKYIVVIFFTGICWAGLCLGGVSAEPITLNLTTQESTTSWGSVQALEPWIQAVEKATKGKVNIRIYPSQTLCEGPETWGIVQRGIADIGWCFHGYWADMTPLTNVITLPGLPFKTAEKGSEILWKLYEQYPEIRAELKDNHILLLYTSNPYILITSQKQVKTIDDMQGMKIRIPGGPPTEQIKALGGVPVLFPMPRSYNLFKLGVIDGMGAPWEAIYGYKLYEVVRYYTQVPFSAVYFSIAMNRQKWNSLPQDIQESMMQVSGASGSIFWGKNYFDTAKQAVYEQAKSADIPINFYSLTKDEQTRWLEISVKPIWKQWVDDMQQRGYTNAPQILDTVIKLSQ